MVCMYCNNEKELAIKLKDSRSQIVQELKISQGKPVDVGGKSFPMTLTVNIV